MRHFIPIITLLAIFVTTDQLDASPKKTWKRYIHELGKRDDAGALAWYSNALKGRIDATGLSLHVHMEEMFGLLIRDYKIRIKGSRRDGDQTIFRVKFQHKDDESYVFEQDVVFIREDGRWVINHPPRLPHEPSFWERRFKSLGTPVIVGGGIVVVVMLFMIRKMLSQS